MAYAKNRSTTSDGKAASRRSSSIKTLSLEKGGNAIDLTASPDGLYFLRIAQQGGMGGTIKMIKK